MEPLRLGSIPSRLGTPDLFITVSDQDQPLLRVDLYARSSSPFQDAIVWGHKLFIGYEESVYVVDLVCRSAMVIPVDRYFAAFYPDRNHLLIASASEVFRVTPNGEVLWRTLNLGIDGVVVTSVEDSIIRGEGEWDPPGGWRAFRLWLDSGKLVA